ncbi:MAG: hypothetical protein Q7R56_00720 [Nanoarchaeota archaeon]|nr:hypothetical protein [Nanoarchaeota archaeon]
MGWSIFRRVQRKSDADPKDVQAIAEPVIPPKTADVGGPIVSVPRSFNVVVEGSYHDEWSRSYFSLMELGVDPQALVINDGSYKFVLAGDKSGLSLDSVEKNASGLEVKVDLLCFQRSLIIGPNSCDVNLLERPRMLVFDNGQAYIDRGVISLFGDFLPELVGVMREIFTRHDTRKAYERFKEVEGVYTK